MEKIIMFLEKFIFTLLPEFIFGVRVQGEKLPDPTFKTTEPTDRPSEFDWYHELRVSSLCGVDQKVFMGAGQNK
jgi:hypothetical protein